MIYLSSKWMSVPLNPLHLFYLKLPSHFALATTSGISFFYSLSPPQYVLSPCSSLPNNKNTQQEIYPLNKALSSQYSVTICGYLLQNKALELTLYTYWIAIPNFFPQTPGNHFYSLFLWLWLLFLAKDRFSFKLGAKVSTARVRTI